MGGGARVAWLRVVLALGVVFAGFDPHSALAAESADAAGLSGAAVLSGAAAPSEAAAPAATSGSAPESTWAYDLASELMSPFCPGRTVASCPSPQATELIQWIAAQEAAGSTREEVIAILVERHGEEILGAPPARGITLWAYVFPVLGFVAFGGIAALVLRRIVAPRAGALAAAAVPAVPASAANVGPAVSSAAADELARIVDAELAERA